MNRGSQKSAQHPGRPLFTPQFQCGRKKMHDVRSLFSHACRNLLRPLQNAWSKGYDFLLLTTMSE